MKKLFKNYLNQLNITVFCSLLSSPFSCLI
jgi:hypothetical protein